MSSTRRRRPSGVTVAPARRSASASWSVPVSTSTNQPPTPVRSSSSGPAAATRPSTRMTALSQTRSTSSSRCDDSSTLMPNSVPTRRMSASMSSRCTGSRPSVGSSSSTSAGSWASAAASFTRCFWPVDIVPTGRNRSSPSPTWYSASLARVVAARWGRPWISARWAHEVVGLHVGRQRLVLGRVADDGPHVGAGRHRVEAEHLEAAAVGVGAARGPGRAASSCRRRWRRAGR